MRHSSAFSRPTLSPRRLVSPVLLLLAGAAPLLAAAPAAAQVALPGAVAPTPEGARAPVAAPPATPRRRPVAAAGLPSAPSPAKVTAATAIAGQTLYRNGRGSEITFALRGKALVVSRLALLGHSDDGSDCRIDVADLPLTVRDEGQPAGMARIGIPVPACPISFDILEGAALETGDRTACAFKETHCTVDPTGLWGPPSATLTPERDKAIERQRAQAEAAVRTSFKRLTSTTRDRPTIMGFARDQAQFSSSREELCRTYADEVKHGFCATRVTEARAAALRLLADEGQIAKDRRKAKHAGPGR